MIARRTCLAAAVAVALTGTSCDRERSNPLDPQGDFVRKRPTTPAGLAAEPGVGVVRLSWQAVEDLDLAGYALLRSEDAAAVFTFLPGRGSGGATITTGKTSFVDSLHSFAGRTFFYRVAAVDTSGLQSLPSGFVGATVLEDKVAPEPPRSLAVIPDESEPRVTLLWTPPVRDAGGGELSGLAGYAILRGEPESGGTVPVDTVAAETRQYVDEGLKALTSYSYSIVAFDQAGNTSSLSQVVQVTTPGLPVPANLAAQSGPGRIEVSWVAVEDEELLGYNVYRSERPDESFERLPGTEGTLFTTGRTSYVDTSVAVGRPYYYKVQSVGRTHRSELSSQVGAEALADEVSPGVPRNVSAVAEGGFTDRIAVRWSAPTTDADGGELTGLSGFTVYRSEGVSGSLVSVATVGPEVREYVDEGLRSLTEYGYAVTAFDGSGNESGQSGLSRARTEGIAIPSGVRAEDGIGRIEVSWVAVEDEELLGYNVYRSERPDESFERLPGTEGTPFTTGRTSYVDTSVAVGRPYYYKVQSVGRTHRSELSSQVGAEALADEVSPGVPRNVSAVAEGGFTDRIAVRWSAPTTDADGGELTGLSGFTVYRSEGVSGSLVSVATVGPEVREYVDEGLRSLTEYGYAVTAFDGSGNESGQSGLSRARTEGIAIPSGVRAEDGIGRIEVSWVAVEDEELLGYNVYRSERPDESFERLPGTEGTPFTTGRTSYVDTSVAVGRPYYYKVQSVGRTHRSELSSQVGAEALADEVSPGVPRNVSAVAEGGFTDRIAVRWSAPTTDADGGELTGLSGFTVYRSEGVSGSLVSVATVGPEVREYVDEGLRSLTEYGYAVTAFDGSGNESGQSGLSRARTEGIAIPSGVRAEDGIGRIEVSWAAVEDEGLIGYNVYRSRRPDLEFERLGSATGASFTTARTSYVDSNLVAGARYYYKVSSVSSAFESELSGYVGGESRSDASAPEPPGGVLALALEEGAQIRVSWRASQYDADGGELTGLQRYVIFRSSEGSSELVAVDTVSAGTTEYVDAGLEAAVVYSYALMAVDASGNGSALTSPVSATTRGLAPPSGLSAVSGIGRITVSWAGSGEADLVGYNVYRSERPDESFERLPGTEGTPFTTGRTSYVDTSVAVGRPYYYKVQSVGRTHRSELSVFVDGEALADEVPPESPRNLSALADESEFGRVTVTWNAPLRDDDRGELTGLSGYRVFRSQGTTDSFVQVAAVSEARYEDSGLEESTTYYYTVLAVDGSGNESGRAAPVRVKTQGADEVSPGVPRNVSAVAEGGFTDRIAVRWSAPTTDADGGELTGLSGFTVYRSEGVSGSLVSVATVGPEVREYVDEGLRSLTEYGYAVTAFDGSGNESGQSGLSRARTEGIAIPSGVRAEDGIGRIEVSWVAVEDEELLGYNVYRSERPDESFERLPGTEGTPFTTGRTSYVDTSVAVGRPYYYKVQSVGRTHRSELSSQVGAEALADEVSPGVPRNVSAVAEGGFTDRIAVRWSAPTTDADGGELTGLSGFTVYRSEGVSGSLVSVATVGPEVREYVDEGLRSLTEYGYAVTAFDGSGNESGQSGLSRARTEGIAIPSGVRAEDGIGRIEVSWAAVEDEGLIGYNVYRSRRPDLEFERLGSATGASFTTARTSYVDSNLVAGARYYYKVSSVSSAFESELSGYVGGESRSDASAPEPPGGVLALALEEGAQIRVSWRASQYDADGGELTGLQRYVIFRSSEGSSELVAVDTVSAGTTEYVDAGLEAAVVYSYALMAVDASGNGSALTSPVSATTRGLAPPSGLSAVSGIGRITVSWAGSGEADLVGYNVYRSERPDESFERLPGTEGTPFTTGRTSYVDTGFVGGEVFFYRASVVTSQGESDLSEFDGATVETDSRPPAAPTFLSGEAVAGDPEVILLEWRAPLSDFSGAELTGLSGYLVFRADSPSGPFREIGSSETAEYRDSGLEQRTTYYYQVQALDPAGNASAPSETESATTSGVDIPKNVSLTSTTPSDLTKNPVVTIRWEASAGVVLRYEVERTTVPNSTDDADYTGIPPASGIKNDIRTSREDDTVERGLTYFYRVRAVDAESRESDWTTPLAVKVSE